MKRKKSVGPAEACAAAEKANYLKSLRTHGRVVDAKSEDVDLPPGATHVAVHGDDGGEPRLVEKRKSFF